MDERQMVQLLESVLQPDTDRVKAATAKLRKDFYGSPSALAVLLHILTSHDSSQLRQLAAVEARTLVPKHWAVLPAQQRPQIREALLQTTLNEQSALVRHSSARVISAIAGIDLDDGEWTELPDFLQSAATSQDASHREVGVYILYALLDSMGDSFVDKLSQLFALFGKTLQDPDSADVRVNTMLALSKIAMLLDADEDPQSLAAFQGLIPNMVSVLKESVDAGNEDRTMQAFEVFQTLLGCDTQIIANHFKDLVHFMVNLASTTELADESRTQALSFLMQCVKYRKLKVQGLKLGEQLTLKSLEIVTELGEFQNEEDDVTPARSALGLLDMMAQSLPPSQVIVPLLHGLAPYVNSQDPDRRRAGILSLGFCVEGAPDFIATQLKEILPLVLRLLDDPDTSVRQAAMHAVARLADDLAEDLGKEHARLVPALLRNLDAASSLSGDKAEDERRLNIVKGVCGAIDAVFEGVEEEDTASYLPELIPRLRRIFDHDDFKVKAAAASALGTVAAASGQGFAPYFEELMHSFSPYVTKKESEEELDLRAVVCDAMGNMASAVGGIAFQPYVRPLMQASEEALHLGHSRIRETSYILWSTLSKVYEEEFSPFIDGVIKALFESLQQEESEIEVELGEEAKDLLGQEISIAGKKIKVSAAEGDGGVSLSKIKGGANAEEDDIVDLDDADSDDEAWDDLTGVTGVALEKEIALEVIADVVSHTRKESLPYLEKGVEIILKLVDHSFEGVRKAAIGALWRMYATLWALSEEGPMEKWQPGLPLKVQPTQDLMKLGEVAISATLALWEDEVERAVVTDINRNVAAALKNCGPAFLTNDRAVEKITATVMAIIQKQHPCQQDLGDDEDYEALDETSEYDWLVIDTALDVVAGLATALGESFGELWKVFEKSVMKYASGSEAIERSTSVGAIAECIASMGPAVSPFTTTLLPVLLHRLTDADPETKSNAAYAVGQLCYASTSSQQITRAYPSILQKLEPLFQQTEARLTDNAAGCLSRMIRAHKDAVPMEDTLPVLVEKLPLTEDYEENTPVWSMIVGLYRTDDPTIRAQTGQIVPAISSVLSPPDDQLTDETKAQVRELVKYLYEKQPALIQGYPALMEAVNG